MSEELEQKYPSGKGYSFGEFEVFELQTTTINQLAQNGIVPNRDYGDYASQKPDTLVIRREPALEVVAVGERKAPGEVTDTNWKAFAHDLLSTKAIPLDAKIGFVTDGISTYWLNGHATVPSLLQQEDRRSLPVSANFNDEESQTFVRACYSHLDPRTGIIRKVVLLDPRLLAEQVWQTVWRISGLEPQDCLATFVELFVYKFLDDLHLMRETKDGQSTSIEHVLSIKAEAGFKYYGQVVRPYIKELFPKGPDGFSVINGIVLKAENEDHNRTFHELLQKFLKFGSLTNITRDFKTKLYESFLKESRITAAFGQFFTPRTVVACMYDIASVDALTPGKIILDPACGVGGFLLESFARDLQGQWTATDKTLKPKHTWLGYDRDWKTTVLGKANALVHCGQLLANRPQRVRAFAKWVNNVFTCDQKSALGSLDRLLESRADVILTNPPYVVSGAKDVQKIIRKKNKYRKYFECKSTGIEGLFVQFIAKALRENGQAVILVPETLLLRSTDHRLRGWLLGKCHVQLAALLPENTFYNTPKRVAVLAFRRRRNGEAPVKNEQTLLALVSEIGETRDAKRFPCRSDLPDLVTQFRKHRADPVGFEESLRFKSISTDSLLKSEVWFIPRWWTEEERIELGILARNYSPAQRIEAAKEKLEHIAAEARKGLETVSGLNSPPLPSEWKEVSLGDAGLFNLRIGKRVLKEEVYQLDGGIELYSANVRKPFGYVQRANAGNLANGGCLWSIDSDFDVKPVMPLEVYSITDHCGQIQLMSQDIDPDYLARHVKRAGLLIGLSRDYRASLRNIRKVSVRIPSKRNNKGVLILDPDAQKAWSEFYRKIESTETAAASESSGTL